MTLADTGERALPAHSTQSLEDYLVYLKHLALYKFAARYVAWQRVLDLGCGEGYGSDALAHAAHFIVAADRDGNVVTHAQRKYTRANLAFVVCDAQHLPFRRSSFDAVVSFEVIEHMLDVPRYLAEIRRVNAGVTLLSTPNRRLRLLPFQKPWDRFHKREYAARDFRRTLQVVFARVDLRGVTARADILEMEKRRVKQNPLIAYPKMLAQLILPARVYDWIKSLKPCSAEVLAARADLTGYSAADFSVSDADLRECINLVAICESD